jgi:uridine kinase
MSREDVLTTLAAAIDGIKRDGPILVGIDGIDGAGKTTLADELVRYLDDLGRHVVRASIDGFHNPREQRIAKGNFSPEGYFCDSFNYKSFIDGFIRPIKEARRKLALRAATFDFRTDREVDDKVVEIFPASIVLFDGIFLFRAELVDFWDYRIFLEIDFETSLDRGLMRDSALMSGKEAARERYVRRYMPGQKLYLDAARPTAIADVIVRNDNPAQPEIAFPGR